MFVCVIIYNISVYTILDIHHIYIPALSLVRSFHLVHLRWVRWVWTCWAICNRGDGSDCPPRIFHPLPSPASSTPHGACTPQGFKGSKGSSWHLRGTACGQKMQFNWEGTGLIWSEGIAESQKCGYNNNKPLIWEWFVVYTNYLW